MGSYGVIKEALLVKKVGGANATIVQKLVPSTVNGMATHRDDGGDFVYNGARSDVCAVSHGGVFSTSNWSGVGQLFITVNIPGSERKIFVGTTTKGIVEGIGEGILCLPFNQTPNAPYTHLFVAVESPGDVFPEIK